MKWGVDVYIESKCIVKITPLLPVDIRHGSRMVSSRLVVCRSKRLEVNTKTTLPGCETVTTPSGLPPSTVVTYERYKDQPIFAVQMFAATLRGHHLPLGRKHRPLYAIRMLEPSTQSRLTELLHLLCEYRLLHPPNRARMWHNDHGVLCRSDCMLAVALCKHSATRCAKIAHVSAYLRIG